MPKIGGKRKKARTHKEEENLDETSTGHKIPKTFIIRRGDIPFPLKLVLRDMREVMYPNTAMKLRDSEKTKLRDYVNSAPTLGVSHMVLFSATENENYVKFSKLPDGPTLTFKVVKYSSHKDILGSQKSPKVFGRTLSSPLLILNGFNNVKQIPKDIVNSPNESQYNIVASMFQNMFPPLDLQKAKIHNTKKAVLFNLDPETDTIDFRYYGIKITQAGINKNIKNLLETKKIPNLKNFSDISDYILREQDNLSENEIEDVIDDSQSKKGDESKEKLTIKLYEIGPRMKLQLIKIEENLMKGNVIYHRIVKKSQKEVEENRLKVKRKLKEKELAKKKMEAIEKAKAEAKKSKKRRGFAEDQGAESDDDEDDGEENDLEGFGNGEEKNDREREDITEFEPQLTKKKVKGAFNLQTGDYESEEDLSANDEDEIDDYAINDNEYV